MQTNLAQARRNYYGGNNTNNGAAQMDSGTEFYHANGSRTGARIDGRVKRKTMMGGASQGPISGRLNRSETMEQEAEAIRAQRIAKGEARARAQASTGSRQTTGYDVPVGGAAKPAGYLTDGRSAGSKVWVPGSPPAAATADKSSQDTTPAQRALMLARRVWKSQADMKASQDRKFSQFRAEVERNPGTYAMEKQVSRVGTKQNNYDGMAKAREAARKRGELNPPPDVQY